jgi:hypothetical protein
MSKEKNDGRFKPGNTLGVGHGRPSLSSEEKALRLTTRTQFKTLMSKYASWTPIEVKNHLENCKDLSIMDMAVLKHLELMNDQGSAERMDWVLDHITGMRPKQSEVTVNSNKTLNLSKLNKEQLAQLKTMVADQEKINNDGD